MRLEEVTLDWLLERISVDKDGCWIWVAYCGCGGVQPEARIGGEYWTVRRLIWTLMHGKKPPRWSQVGVICEDQRCVHPDHIIARKRGELMAGVRMKPQQRMHIVESLRARSKLSEEGVIAAQTGSLGVAAWVKKYGFHESYYYRIQHGESRRQIDFSNPFAGLGA